LLAKRRRVVPVEVPLESENDDVVHLGDDPDCSVSVVGAVK
jgi:hypothetical protein